MNRKLIIDLVLSLAVLLLTIVKPEYILWIGIVYVAVIIWKRIEHKPVLKFKITMKSK